MPLGMCVATPELLQGEAALKRGEDEGRSQRHQCHRGWLWLGMDQDKGIPVPSDSPCWRAPTARELWSGHEHLDCSLQGLAMGEQSSKKQRKHPTC